MTARLKSLQLLRRDDGWTSPNYQFGQLTTLVTGDNGAGKTPMLRALAVALGAKVELPQLINQKCRAVRLVLQKSASTVVIERAFAQSYATFEEDGRTTRCLNEEDISHEIMRHLSITPRSLVRRQDNQPVGAYMSVLAPIFVVDQDHGWRDAYEAPPNVNFLHDQREEALRWILDVPKPSATFPAWIPRGRRLDPRTSAFDYHESGTLDASPQLLSADAWLPREHIDSEKVQIVEHSAVIAPLGVAFSMLWIPDREVRHLDLAA